MNRSETVIHLSPCLFNEKEKPFIEVGPLSASIFRFATGVCGLRLKNELGQLILLPYQGQQIWSAEFRGRVLTMKSMFPEPRPNHPYLETYGGFFLHCGFTAMGVPGRDDKHPLHGELPNAEYSQAHVVLGQDENGAYIGMGGQYQHTVAFGCNYIARPVVKLYAGSSVLRVAMEVTNLRSVDMEYMYLAHINFRPVDYGRLVCTAPSTPERVRVRQSVPAQLKCPPGYHEFVKEMGRNPAGHTVLKPGLPFNPELVFTLTYDADEAGWAHSMHMLPDGTADYVAHRPDQLDKVVRWIARPGDQDALGFAMPSTSEPEGYIAEKAKGNVRVLPAHAQWRADFGIGALTAVEAQQMEGKIDKILGKR
jgi:uncharacterized protein DUF4432